MVIYLGVKQTGYTRVSFLIPGF